MLGESGSKWLERLHMQLARELRANDWSQAEIAGMLGSTQSTVSRQYGRDLPELAGTYDELTVDGWASEIAAALKVYGPNATLTKQRFVMEIVFGPGQILKFDKSLTGMDLDSDQEERALLKRLEWAVSRIDVNRVSSWFSRVGTNIASSLDDATTPEQIAAYPGRISIVHNRIRHHDTPRFGSSSHLAQILLSIKKYDTETNAIINISVPISNEKVDILRINNAVLEMGWQMGMSDKGIIQQEPGSPRWDCVLDKGAFGWEPCLYIMAHNPLELVDRTHRFISALEASNA